MSKTSMTVFSTLLLTAAAQAGFVPNPGGYDVFITKDGATENSKVHVSADLKTWTYKGLSAETAKDLRGSCGIGDGYLYWGDSSKTIYRCKVKDGDVDVSSSGGWKTWGANLANQPGYLVASPDKVWFYYTGRQWSWTGIRRIRISDPTISKEIAPASSKGAQHAGGNIRFMTVNRDGTLWIAARGDWVDNCTSCFYKNGGLYRFDPTMAGNSGGMELERYALPLAKGGGMVFFTDDNAEVYSVSSGDFQRYRIGDPTLLGTTPSPAGMMFGGDYLGGTMVACSYETTKNVRLCRLNNGKVEHFAGVSGQMANGSDIVNLADCADTGTQLPNINAVWYFNDTQGNALFNGAVGDTKWRAIANNTHLVQFGVSDAVALRSCAFRAGGYATVENGSDIVPATGDFTILTWGAFAAGDGERAIFANGTDFFGLKGGKVTFVSGGTEVAGATAVTDEKWHHVGVVRRGGKVEIWVDGVIEAQADFAGAITQATWQIGASGGAKTLDGAYLDELRVYPVALLPEVDIQYLYNLPMPRPGAVKKPVNAFDSKVVKGVVPLYAEVADCAPSLAKVGSRYYVAVGSEVYKSTDDGASWSKIAAATSVGKLSLFADGDSLKAFGLADSAGHVAFLSLDAGEAAWTETALDTSVAVPGMTAGTPAVAGGRVYMGTSDPAVALKFGLFSFAYANGAPSDPRHAELDDTAKANVSDRQNRISAATAFADAAGKIHVYGALENNCVDFAEVRFHAVAPDASTLAFDSIDNLPGSSKRMAVAYDPASRKYWAVTMAQHYGDYCGIDGFTTYSHNNAANVALYCSDDLVGWRFCGDVIARNRNLARFSNPSILVDGDDLVIAFGAADKAVCADLTKPNLILLRKVAGFRALDRAKRRKFGLFVTETATAHRFVEFFRDDNGDWLPVREIKGTFGGKKIENPRNVALYDRTLYLTGEGNRPVWQFDFDGGFQRVWTQENDGFMITRDGKFAYSSAEWGDRYFIADLLQNPPTVTQFHPDAHGTSTRVLAELNDGNIAYIPNRDDYKTAPGGLTRFYIMDKDGKCLTPNGIGAVAQRCQNIGYDAVNDALYFSPDSIGLHRLLHPGKDSQSADVVRIGDTGGNVGITFYGEERRILVGWYGAGYQEFWDVNGSLKSKFVIGTGKQCYGAYAFKYPPLGLTVLLK